MPAISPTGRASLRQHLIENFSQAELEELAFDMGLDAETLARVTKSEFARALILHFEDRGNLDRLVKEALLRRPNVLLERDLSEAENATPTTAPSKFPIPLSSAPKSRTLMLIGLAIVAFAVVTVLLRGWIMGTMPLRAQPSAVTTDTASSVVSNLPGTRLQLNTTSRSGVDEKLKPRDVWRVRLQAQQLYKVEIQSSVQDGISLGLLQLGTSNIPDTVETTDINVCSNASQCATSFTPSVSGDYYIVVYGVRQSVGYTLTIRDR